MIRLVLALVPLVVLLGAAEAALRLSGLGRPDPLVSRGFDPSARYLVPHGDGGWRTAIFGGEQEELLVPARDDRIRVVLLGGSNTRFLPEQVLALLLDEREGPTGRRFEVINLGREGYGSERVAILGEQALVLEPDVLVVYAGHNEFLEKGFAAEIDAVYGHPLLTRAMLLLSRLRLFHVVADALAAPEARGPEPVDPAAGSFADVPFETTMRYYDAYRSHLERIAEVAGRAGVPVVLCTLVSNDFTAPYASPLPPRLPDVAAERFETLRTRGIGRIPYAYRRGVVPPERLWARAWLSEEREELPGGFDARGPRLRRLSGVLAAAPPTAGFKAESVDGAHWPSPRHWRDEVVQLMRTMRRVAVRELPPEDRAELKVARNILEDALAIVPDDARVLFGLGLAVQLLGEDDARAAELLLAARNFDHAPHSATVTTNSIVRRVAAAHPGVQLLDVDRLVRACCPAGLVGYEIMMDHCHLQPGVRVVLMEELAGVIRSIVRRGGTPSR